MDPFFIFALAIIITAKCLEFLAPLRLYILTSKLAICPIVQIILGNELKEPKNWKSLQQDLRSVMVAWLHAERNSQEQLKMVVIHAHSHSKDIPQNDIKKIIFNIERQYKTSQQYASMLLDACQRSLVMSSYRKWLNRILMFILVFFVAFAVCNVLDFRFLNLMGVYKFSEQHQIDMAITSIFIALGTYFWNAAIFLLAKAKERVQIRRNVLA